MQSPVIQDLEIGVPLPLGEGAIRQLALALGRGAIESGERLAAMTRRVCEVEIGDVLEPIDVTKLRLDDLVFVAIGTVDGGGRFETVALAAFEGRGAIGIVDIFLGGPGLGTARDLTDLESLVLRQQLPAVISPLVSAALRIGETDYELRFVGDEETIPLDNRLVRLGVQLRVDGTVTPLALLVPDPDQPVRSAGGTVEEALEPVSLPVAISLRSVTIPGSELDQLAPGDVIRLDHGRDELARGCLAGEVVLEGALGRSGDRVAILVDHIVLGALP